MPPGLGAPSQGATEKQAGLEVLVTTIDSVRAGGWGTADVDLARRGDAAVTAHGVRVRLRGAAGMTVAGAGGPGWSCSTRAGLTTCVKARLGASDAAPRIRVRLRASQGVRAGTRPLRAEVTWRERAGSRRATGTRPRGGFVTYSDITNGAVETDAGLSVRVRASGAMIALEKAGDASHLQASVSGLGDTTATLDWRQACLTAQEASADPACDGRVAPAARFISPRHVDDTAATEVAAVELPMTAAPVRLVFDATVREGGDMVTGRVAVTSRPVATPTYDPGIDSIEELRSVKPVQEPATAARTSAIVRGSVGSRGPSRLVAGRPATIVARVQGRTVRGVSWRVIGDGRQILSGAERRGTSLRVTAPRSLAGAVITLVATATLADGTSVELPELVTVTAPPRAVPATTRTPEGVRREAAAALARTAERGRTATMNNAHDSRGPDGTVCDVADRVARGAVQPVPTDPNGAQPGYPDITPQDTAPPDIALGETGLLWLGRATATREGDRCSVSFEGGELHYGDYVFVQVSGRITRTGLRILSGAFNPPERWLKASGSLRDAVAAAAGDVLRFSVPEDSALRLGAGIDRSGEWRDLSGELTIDAGLSLLPLPNGWRFSPARLELDVNGVMALTIEASAPEGQSGSVSIRGSAGGSGTTSLDVEAAGLVVMQQVMTDPSTGEAVVDPSTGAPRMSQVTANLGGDLDMNFSDRASAPRDVPVQFGLSTTIRGSLQNLTLASNFTVERIGFEWTPGSISADARVRVGRGPQPQAVLAGGGTYRGADDWSVRISSRLAWQVTSQLRVDSLDGQMERKAGRTTISARGSASGWPSAAAFEFDSITAELTNACPVPAVPGRPCKDATARVALKASGYVRLPQFTGGADERMPWSSTADIDLSTRIFTLTGGLSSASGIGPAELKLKGVAIQLSNDVSRQWCTVPGADPAARGEVRLGISATGEVFGKQVQFSGEFGGSAGLCLIGRMGDMPSDVPQASLFREVQVAYTSQRVLVNLPGGVPRLAGKREMSVYADFTLPTGVQRAASGDYFLMGTLGLADRSIVAAVGVTYPDHARKIIAGSASGSHLGLSGVDFAFVWTRTELAASATARMDYVTPASGGDIGASTTPLAGTLAFDLRRATFSVEARVDSQRAPGGRVANAFGVQDLDIGQLGVRGSVGGNTSISFSADVTLPGRWVKPIGIRDRTQEVLDFSISETEPCVRIALRRPAGDETGVAVDLANAGLVTAHEVGLTIAPLGCTLPGNQIVEPGFGFVFDGYLAGVFRVDINARVSLPTPANPRLAVFTHAEIGALDLGGVARFDKTLLDIDIDTSASRYKVAFSGGLDIIGNRVAMAVDLAAENGRVTFSAHAEADLNVVGFAFTGVQDLAFAVNKGDVERFRIHAKLDARVLGVSLARMGLDFDYDDGQVQKWRFSIGATVPLIIASAGGDIAFDYALHRARGREQTKDPFVRKTFDIDMSGKLRFLFWSTSFRWNVFHYEGALTGAGREGVSSDVEEKQRQPQPPALPPVSWSWMKGDPWTTPVAVSSVTYRARYTTTSVGDGAPQMLLRGGLDITACEVSTATGRCVPDRDATKDIVFRGRIDQVGRRIIVEEGQADCTAAIVSRCRGWRDVELTGDDWRAMVAWIEAARNTFAEQPDNKRAGKVLPPITHWSETSVPTSLAWADFGGSGATILWGFTRGVSDSPRPGTEVVTPFGRFGSRLGVARADGTRGLNRLIEAPVLPRDGAPARGVPMAADWDGDGASTVSVWFGRSSAAYGYNGAGLWTIRHDGGRVEVRDDPGTCPAFCQPVEPPGTVAYELTGRNDRDGASGAAFPVVGNWDGFQKDGSAAETPGLATYEGGAMNWTLRPATGPPISVSFGSSALWAQPVPRPITGDWNGDGITDIGVYDPPARSGDVGRFRLLTSLRYDGSRGEPDPDITVAMGSYGSMPVTGDWNGDQITDIGTVSRPGADRRATWSLRHTRTESCAADCTPDRVLTTSGTTDMVPLAGRWR